MQPNAVAGIMLIAKMGFALRPLCTLGEKSGLAGIALYIRQLTVHVHSNHVLIRISVAYRVRILLDTVSCLLQAT